MKRITASDARKDWFRILDEVAAGEVVIIDRNGQTIQIRRCDDSRAMPVPDYRDLVRVPEGAEEADRWGWEWSGEEGAELRPVEDDPS